MRLTKIGIEGAWLAESPIWRDNRGLFREWFKFEDLRIATGIDFSIQQANISQSQRGVIRGIHYSLAPHGQAKWITCISGRVIDVIVDIRPDSKTFRKIEQVELSATEGKAVFIDAGLGHGLISLVDDSVVSYLLNSTYSPDEEFEINPLDPELGIDWKLSLVGGMGVILSPKDAQAPTLAERLADGKLPRLR